MYKRILYFILIFGIKTIAQDPKNFGPYEPVWNKLEQCRGPKSRNVTIVDANLNKHNDVFYLNVTLNFTAKVSMDEIKITVYSTKNNNKNLMWVYKVTDPCQHFMIAGIIEKELNARNCVVEKGTYNRTVDLSTITKNMIGSSFYYGDYIIKAVASSKKGNILCHVMYLKFLKNTSD